MYNEIKKKLEQHYGIEITSVKFKFQAGVVVSYQKGGTLRVMFLADFDKLMQ